MTTAEAVPEELVATARKLAAEAGQAEAWTLTRLTGGANNRVYRLDAKGRSLLLKAYFQHEDDSRDRLGAEYFFARFAWDAGLRCLPQPLASDPIARVALFEFVEGRKLSPGEVGAGEIGQALDFFQGLNTRCDTSAAKALPAASETRWTLHGQLALVGGRVEALETFEGGAEIDEAAKEFVAGELAPFWERVLEGASAAVPDEEKDLAPGDRRLSPSDFGFHNAILASDGKLRFIDFEYAGWDDPARTACDFFCQPAVPAPLAHFDRFVDALGVRARAGLLLPVYRVKWVCILLNEFLPVGGRRRAFGGSEARKAEQLAKARKALQEAQRRP